MSAPHDIARAIMALAVAITPSPRRNFARAMANELECVEHGALNWALGSLGTALRWRIAADATYVALLALPLVIIMTAVDFWIIVFLRSEFGVSKDVFRTLLPSWGLVEPFLVALALGAHRPRAARTTALICWASSISIGPLLSFLTNGTPILLWFGSHATYNMAPPLVGMFANFAAWWFGTAAGARLTRRRGAAAA